MYLVLSVLFCILRLSSATWSKPYFLPTEDVDVQFGAFDEARNEQPVSVPEELTPGYILTYINTDASATPKINVVYGNLENLGANIVKTTDNQWALVINKRQDYENPEMREYRVEVTADGATRTLSIAFANEYDNGPIIVPKYDPCRLQEGFVGRTHCFFEVKHADGIVDSVELNLFGPETARINLAVDNWGNIYKEYIWIEIEQPLTISNPVKTYTITAEDSNGNTAQTLTHITVVK